MVAELLGTSISRAAPPVSLLLPLQGRGLGLGLVGTFLSTSLPLLLPLPPAQASALALASGRTASPLLNTAACAQTWILETWLGQRQRLRQRKQGRGVEGDLCLVYSAASTKISSSSSSSSSRRGRGRGGLEPKTGSALTLLPLALAP